MSKLRIVLPEQLARKLGREFISTIEHLVMLDEFSRKGEPVRDESGACVACGLVHIMVDDFRKVSKYRTWPRGSSADRPAR